MDCRRSARRATLRPFMLTAGGALIIPAYVDRFMIDHSVSRTALGIYTVLFDHRDRHVIAGCVGVASVPAQGNCRLVGRS